MNRIIILLVLLFTGFVGRCQITTPVTKAGFGIDADLQTDYNGLNKEGYDDWFYSKLPRSGHHVIDTTDAAYMMTRFAGDPDFRKRPFSRNMSVAPYSVINNRLWIDAIYIRDYNGQAGGDSTAFLVSNKNGDSPEEWAGGVTSVLDKNDIAEMMIHVRREGTGSDDSLWFMGGLSLQGTSGNRYFDFELYQTEIYFDPSSGRFYNFGPDAGHTSWKFDSIGNVLAPGDVIFTAEYSSSSLTAIEARIWINRSALLMDPVGFDWGGDFVGAGNHAEYGYASIRPETAGAYYYGLQCADGTWAGPFGFIDAGNDLQQNYKARQFMEFGVNLSKLGLDPLTMGAGNCSFPFRKLLVKTRTSTSFTSELKDFVGPFEFFRIPSVDAVAEVPVFCGVVGVSDLRVQDPNPFSFYSWSTPDGSIYGSTTGPNIVANAPGTYIVNQFLPGGCALQASDTLQIVYDASCMPLENNWLHLEGTMLNNKMRLTWTIDRNQKPSYFEPEKSRDGKQFFALTEVVALPSTTRYQYHDPVNVSDGVVYYRIKELMLDGTIRYSNIIRNDPADLNQHIRIFPNPVVDQMRLEFYSGSATTADLQIFNSSGAPVYRERKQVKAGNNSWIMSHINWAPGIYIVRISNGKETMTRKLVKTGPAIF